MDIHIHIDDKLVAGARKLVGGRKGAWLAGALVLAGAGLAYAIGATPTNVFKAGDVISAKAVNDNFAELYSAASAPAVHVRAIKKVSTQLSAGQKLELDFPDESGTDKGTPFQGVPFQFTAPIGGVYSVSVAMTFLSAVAAGNPANFRGVACIRKNGACLIQVGHGGLPDNITASYLHLHDVVRLAKGDKLSVYAEIYECGENCFLHDSSAGDPVSGVAIARIGN